MQIIENREKVVPEGPLKSILKHSSATKSNADMASPQSRKNQDEHPHLKIEGYQRHIEKDDEFTSTSPLRHRRPLPNIDGTRVSFKPGDKGRV